jgi:hypothetical protein
MGGSWDSLTKCKTGKVEIQIEIVPHNDLPEKRRRDVPLFNSSLNAMRNYLYYDSILIYYVCLSTIYELV